MNIFEAARLNNVKELQKNLSDNTINAVDSRGSTALIIAAYYDNRDAVALLLSVHADMEIQDNMGNTALMGASFKGYKEVAEMLLINGAIVDAENGNGATALTFAATFGRNEIITLLLGYRACPRQKDKFGKNPIDYALSQENAEGYEKMVTALSSCEKLA